MNSRITLSTYETNTELFEKLGEMYPTGEYLSHDGSKWFAVEIEEKNLKLIWFL